MYRFVDVTPDKWYYDHIMEASNTIMWDGKPWVTCMPYTNTKEGKPRIYQEFKAQSGQVEFVINSYIVPSANNPLHVYVNGVMNTYKEIKYDSGKTKTTIVLFVAPKKDSIVSLVSYGEPVVDEWNRPDLDDWEERPGVYPHHKLEKFDKYIFIQGSTPEVAYAFGRELRKALYREEDVQGMHDQDIAKRYIGLKQDTYIVTPSGRIHLPYNLDKVTVKFTYYYEEDGVMKKKTEEIRATSGAKVYRVDRFFPNAIMERHEIYETMNRLREHLYYKYTDNKPPTANINYREIAYQGQQVFRVNGTFPAGEYLMNVTRLKDPSKPASEDNIERFQKGGVDYKEFDNNTIVMNVPLEKGESIGFYLEKSTGTHAMDLGTNTRYYVEPEQKYHYIDNKTKPWVRPMLNYDTESLRDGTPLLYLTSIQADGMDSFGYPIVNKYYYLTKHGGGVVKQWIFPYNKIHRIEAVTIVARFYKWAMERFR